MQSSDLVGDNIEKIAVLFPNCITETIEEGGKLTRAIDFELIAPRIIK